MSTSLNARCPNCKTGVCDPVRPCQSCGYSAGLRVRVEDIRRGRAKSAAADSPRHTYAVLLSDATGALLISATLGYILDKAEERGWEIVSLSTKPWVPRAVDPETATMAKAVAEVIAAAVDAAAQARQ